MGVRDQPEGTALSSRLRDLEDEPNFGILMGDGSGAVTFPYVAERLKSLLPFSTPEQASVLRLLSRYVDRQLRGGAPTNLKGIETVLDALGVADLPIPAETVRALEPWLTRLSSAEMAEMMGSYRLRNERNGTLFESPWHQDFIPGWQSSGLEYALRQHVHNYLTAKNAWVRANGIAPEDVEGLVRARETLARLASRSPRPAGKSGFPRSVRELLHVLSGARGRVPK